MIRAPGPVLRLAARIYGRAALWRRRRVQSRPHARRRLRQPVVSIGNLALGGRGKTPVVAHVAGLLRDAGERPAILSRGYARADVREGVVVVRDAGAIRAGLDEAGDEPLMLARQLDGVAVLVSHDRHLAGCLAESRLGCTVHLLDDGYQHVQLARDVDLLLATPRDLREERVVPAGRLREPVVAATEADALLVTDGSAAEVEPICRTLGIGRVFEVSRHLTVPRVLEPFGAPPRFPRAAPAIAAAGLARPECFFADLASGGWAIAGTFTFPDHHRYTRHDVDAVAERVRETGAVIVLTTEKDLVRWLPLAPLPFPLAWVPLEVAVEPAEVFLSWLLERVRLARSHGLFVSGTRARE